LGSGGPKPKSIRALQEDELLKEANEKMREVSRIVMEALKERDLQWSRDGMELIGDLKFTSDE
jgi:hypothetical protein